jgi:hypothetical protein
VHQQQDGHLVILPERLIALAQPPTEAEDLAAVCLRAHQCNASVAGAHVCCCSEHRVDMHRPGGLARASSCSMNSDGSSGGPGAYMS